ncbi:MAG: ABC transporter ATP-binding protein [Deltaproteobacteria bacterium]|nr:ABC transporter ATP-binding protein [Deltaproteobacteria bacterium]MBW2152179.1 ABC transporter ATP-binding protein [Deltaproteobacteria bacterium]
MIKLEKLTKRFGKTVAVNDLNLEISPGEIFGFIGPNGAGKTTTIRMMAGILQPSSGTVTICGIPMHLQPEQAKMRIGFIPDRPYLYEKLTGMEFLRFTADLFHVDSEEFLTRAEYVLGMFSLLDWSEELIESYSHGMKQRLIMAAALLHDPQVIIVDEPMVGLDPAGIKMVKELFKNLAEKKVTIFLSTHTLALAEDLCHRLGIIDKGNLLAVGTATELKQRAQLLKADLEEAFIKLTSGAVS